MYALSAWLELGVRSSYFLAANLAALNFDIWGAAGAAGAADGEAAGTGADFIAPVLS
jgi:hypothetical protein